MMYWDWNMDCLFDANLDTTFGLKSRPHIGELFSRLWLVNDTTLSVRYEFPEWVAKYNQQTKDPKFPRQFQKISTR